MREHSESSSTEPHKSSWLLQLAINPLKTPQRTDQNIAALILKLNFFVKYLPEIAHKKQIKKLDFV